jgi:hypothetical protein
MLQLVPEVAVDGLEVEDDLPGQTTVVLAHFKRNFILDHGWVCILDQIPSSPATLINSFYAPVVFCLYFYPFFIYFTL